MSNGIYEQRAVLFLDILGFKALIDNKQEHKIFSALSTSVASANSKPSFPDLTHTTTFSDSIVISHRVEPAGIQNIINSAAILSWAFLRQGILTRGGIALGELHHTRDRLFGPAMNEAYLLESELATYPRIIVSDEIKALILRESQEQQSHYQINCDQEVLRQDFDGAWHVNLMTHRILSPFTSIQDTQALFAEKVKVIQNALDNPTPPPGNNQRAQRKQGWFRNYLLSCIEAGPSHNPKPIIR